MHPCSWHVSTREDCAVTFHLFDTWAHCALTTFARERATDLLRCHSLDPEQGISARDCFLLRSRALLVARGALLVLVSPYEPDAPIIRTSVSDHCPFSSIHCTNKGIRTRMATNIMERYNAVRAQQFGIFPI